MIVDKQHALPDEVIGKVCHYIACIYKHTIHNQQDYNTFIEITYKVAKKLADHALYEQKYAVGGLGIRLSLLSKEKLYTIVYHKLIADITNPTKFQKEFNLAAKYHFEDNQQPTHHPYKQQGFFCFNFA